MAVAIGITATVVVLTRGDGWSGGGIANSEGANAAGPSTVTGLAISPDGHRLYVTNDGGLAVVDTATMTATRSAITTGFGTHGIAARPDGRHLHVTLASPDGLAVADTSTGAVVDGPTVGVRPAGVAVSRDRRRWYVANSGDSTVTVVDAATNEVVGRPDRCPGSDRRRGEPGRPPPLSLAGQLDPRRGDRRGDGQAGRHGHVARHPGGGGLAVSPGGRRLYVGEYYGTAVTVVDTPTNKGRRQPGRRADRFVAPPPT